MVHAPGLGSTGKVHRSQDSPVDLVVSPTTIAFNTQSGAPAPALQAGEVLDALVVAVLDSGKVRLSLANVLIEVDTKVPLTPGTTVRLAVKTTSDGIQLVVVDPAITPLTGKSVANGSAPSVPVDGKAAGPAAPNVSVGAPKGEAPAIVVDVAAGDVPVKILAKPLPGAEPPVQAGSDADLAAHAPAPAVALSAAVRVAAAIQNGLAQVFADTAVAAQSPALPEQVRVAATNLLALRVPLQAEAAAKGPGKASAGPVQAVVVRDIKISPDQMKAAFARSGLFLEAKLATETGDGQPAKAPADLKAALVVFRQVLKTWLDSPSGPTGLNDTIAVLKQSPSIAPGGRTVADGLLSDRAGIDPVGEARAPAPFAAAASDTADPAPARTAPPPPYRGAPTAAQPPAAPSLTADATPREIGEKLLGETDAALARQTLLQAASLDRPDPLAPRHDPSGPRWTFEIPFATPQGTAMAQFEIARDGKHAPTDGIKPIWRARFTLDIEPMGPVHAQISLTGARAAVTMWAERGETAQQLRDNAEALTAALKGAEFEPGDVVVRDGFPPRPRDKAAGRFVDRAS